MIQMVVKYNWSFDWPWWRFQIITYSMRSRWQSYLIFLYGNFLILFCTDGMTICHLPYGPTAYFTLMNVVMRHDIPNVGTMSEAFPRLIFHNLSSKLGKRVRLALCYEMFVFLLVSDCVVFSLNLYCLQHMQLKRWLLELFVGKCLAWS